MYSDLNPRLIGFHVFPASSLRKAPADEIAAKIRLGLLSSRMIVCRHRPPAPGAHDRPEQRGVLDPGVDGVGVGQRRLEVPDARELPGVIRVVVPLMSPRRPVVM